MSPSKGGIRIWIMKDIDEGSLSPECNLHFCLQKPSKTMKWKGSAASFHLPSHLPKLFPPSLSLHLPLLLSPSCHFPCRERGVLIIQAVSLCVCCDSCRWENSHGESDLQGFLFVAFPVKRFGGRTQWGRVGPSDAEQITEQPVSTSPFGFVVHAYFTSAVYKIFNSYYCQKDA